MFVKNLKYNLPDKDGFFGEFGGAFVPEDFKNVLNRLNIEFEKAIKDENFLSEVYDLLKDYSGRTYTAVLCQKPDKSLWQRKNIFKKRRP